MNQSFNFKSFLVFLRRNKLYMAINIFGFAISLMFVVLFGLYLQKEYSADNFHEKKDRIYRLVNSNGSGWAPPVGRDIQERYPEIETTVSFTSMGAMGVRTGSDGEMLLAQVLAVDTNYFSVFTYPFTEGDPATMLRTRSEAVVTENFARKFFGRSSAVGEMIRFPDEEIEFMVGGVVKELPKSHLADADIFVPLQNLPVLMGWDDALNYNAWNSNLYVVVRPGADLAPKLADMESFFTAEDGPYWMFNSGRAKEVRMEPLESVYFSEVGSWITRHNDPRFVSILAVTILAILFFAVINYINLSVAQTGFRAKEASIRRLLGGTKQQLFGSFILESVLLCFLSLLLAIGLAAAFQGIFNRMLGADMSLTEGLTWTNLAIATAGIVVLGGLAGMVPALVITRYKPIEVVRGTFKRKTKMVYSKVLITFQYAITIVLIGCTVTIVRQVNFMTKGDLGFNSEFVISAHTYIPAEKRQLYYERMTSIGGVEQVAFGQGAPFSGYSNSSFTDRNGQNMSFTNYRGDSAYLAILGIEVLSETGNISPDAVWFNETAYRKTGLSDDDTEYRDGPDWFHTQVRGKVKDFHTHDFSRDILEASIALLPPDWSASLMLIKVSGASAYTTLREVEKEYNRLAGGNLFDSQAAFLDENIAQVYTEQKRLSSILTAFSVLAVIISALGMLAMATYFMRQRAQVVAVRKVFGAMDVEVLRMLMWNFLRLVLVAFLLASPVIWYLMRGWLSGYAYRIPISWDIFAMAGMLALAIAGVTVFWQSVRAARANPVLAIKD